MKKTTSELLEMIKHSPSLSSYLETASAEFVEITPLHTYLEKILVKKNLKKSDIIRSSGLDRGYCYDIFSGSKFPSKDKVLAICFAASLSLEEVQQLLKCTGYAPLYARMERDSIILFALEHSLSLSDVNELLYEMNHPCLL